MVVMKKILVTFLFALFFIIPIKAFARENVDYWYIKNFDSYITVNKDSSLIIDEKITADCGNGIDKHGIFRVLPTVYVPESGKKINLHIDLISITDFSGKPYKYETISSRIANTISWKIGDPNVAVQSVNEYEIKYKIANGVRTENGSFDESYWNLNGNFWDIETDQFNAYITFPNGVNKENATINLYSGEFKTKDTDLASYKWDGDALQVSSMRTLAVGEGITASVTFPKGIVAPYVPSFIEKYGYLLTFLIPIAIFLLCLSLWRKYGRDPKINNTVVPEFEIPEKMSPMSLGMVYADGRLRSNFISATIVNLAVKKAIKIEEIPKKGMFSSIDFKLINLGVEKELNPDEKELLSDLFGGEKEILISDLKNEFYKNIPTLSSFVSSDLEKRRYLLAYSRTLQIVFIVFALAFMVSAFFVMFISGYLTLNMFIAGVIILIFSFIIPKRPIEGAKFNLRVRGLKLYIETAEKYRQKFNEKENIFERFLPYAMMFGVTKLWIDKMKSIYGEEYFNNYMPLWYVGSISHFDAVSFNSAINSMSSNMSSTISSSPSSSGSGGGGFSGGGGGGGGGGGW